MAALCLAVLGAVVVMGDQRQFHVVAAAPDEGTTVAVTLRMVSLTFSSEPHRERVEAAFRIEPPVAGTPRWRGQTFEYVVGEPLEPGTYEVSLDTGTLGRAAERLREPFSLSFEVRHPGIALVEIVEDGERLIEVREDADIREFTRGERILDFAIAPDGAIIAAVVGLGPERTRLELINVVSGDRTIVVDTENVEIATVRWAADSQALLAVRRDALPDGGMGVPRAWLLRLNGEFVAPVDPEGEPTLSPVWSPDAQAIAYSAPATGRLVVMNLGTQQVQNLGQPRSGTFAWSPNSRMVAFEGVPDRDGSNPIQPVRVKSLDGEVDLVIGEEGESQSQPRFLDDDVVMSLRRGTGERAAGTDLVFHSIDDGSQLRAVRLAEGTDSVLNWDLDPTGTEVVYTTQAGAALTTVVVNLATGTRETIAPVGRKAVWLP